MTPVSRLSRREMKKLIRYLLDQLATEIDMSFDDETIGLLAENDSLFQTFRLGVNWMNKNQLWVTKATKHMSERIERCYNEHFKTPLSDPPFTL